MTSSDEEDIRLRHEDEIQFSPMSPNIRSFTQFTKDKDSQSLTEVKVSHGQDFSQTEVKSFASYDETSTRAYFDENVRPPSYNTSISQTEVKVVIGRNNSVNVTTADVGTDTADLLSVTDKTPLQDAIEILKLQQEEIKKMQSIHEHYLNFILESQPNLQKVLDLHHKKDSTEGPRSPLPQPPSPKAMKETPRMIHLGGLLEEKIYIQFEQLYVNAKIFKPTAIGGSNGFYDDILRSEISSLKEANKKLREKVTELEKKLQNQGRQNLLIPICSGMKASKSLTRLDDCNINTSAIAGRPTSPVPPPLLIQDIRPIEMTFKWTINDYMKKLREEKRNGSKESSCPFYLSHCGYKAQLEAYLNGNGTAKNKCISVFLRIVKGEYDRHLKWPVNLHVVVILVNQSENRADSLKAGGNMFQYTQPYGMSESECDSWGLVEFVKHDLIKTKHYIRDDRIVLKCRVTILA
nr:TNF receptor-associated factor 4-like [Biomphalaria glabrata]